MSINILHTADLHLRDSQFGRMDRGRDFTNSLFQLVDLAERHDCEYILAAGDILHTKRPSSQNILDLMDMNRRLLDKGIRMLCIAGNHDECDPNWISLIEQESIKQAGTTAIEDITNKIVNIPLKYSLANHITVYGAPFPDMHPDDFRAQAGKWPEADILLYHGGVKEFSFYPMGDKALSINDLPSSRYQVIALGDIHVCKYVYREDCLIGYPGPIEYCSANEGPTKSCTILRFEEKSGKLLKLKEDRDIVALRTRRVIQREIQTEADMNTLLEDIRAHKAEKPIIRAWYSPSINDVFTRIAAIADPCECIIRVEPRGSDTYSKVRDDVIDTSSSLKPSDFVSDFFSSEEPLYKVAMSCCNAETKPGVVIDKYIDEQLSTYYHDQQF
jgi:DNA repair exonuclease SbcCD nuclease subunit